LNSCKQIVSLFERKDPISYLISRQKGNDIIHKFSKRLGAAARGELNKDQQ